MAAFSSARVCLNSVTTPCDGVLPCAWQAAAISSLARMTSGWLNWPSSVIADAGIAPPWADTKSIRPKDSDSSRGWAAIACTWATAAGDSISACTGIRRSRPWRPQAASIVAIARSATARLSTFGIIR